MQQFNVVPILHVKTIAYAYISIVFVCTLSQNYSEENKQTCVTRSRSVHHSEKQTKYVKCIQTKVCHANFILLHKTPDKFCSIHICILICD